MATAAPPPVPQAAPPIERVRNAYAARTQSDYVAKFWTALGWTIITCGIYSYYVIYQLVRRDRDHNARRLEELDAATAVAWERATSAGQADGMRQQFERVGSELNVLRAMTSDFRDPIIWLLICIFTSGVGTFVLYVLLDQDLVKHDRAERAVEAELATVYGALGMQLPTPGGSPKGPHNYGLRVVVLLVTFGLYGLWWQYNVMEEPNAHYEENWVWEDGLRTAVGG
ncbi:MAG: hypothetical protein JWP02_2231 [Acidimicrobiales bacterium]|nr:hypothetical protein [Acidimicrobiales bacterium]